MNNKEKIKYFCEVVTSNGLVDEVEEYVATNCTTRVGEKSYYVGVEGMKEHILAVRRTYPDLEMTVIRQYSDGDYIISEFIAAGTHMGEWLGMKPTNKKLIFTGVDVDRVVDGKIIEHSGAMNTFETLFEEGIIKPA